MVKRINSVIRTLILSDVCLFFGMGLLSPIFALFVVQNIEGAGIETVGYAASFYWIARLAAVKFVSRFLDIIEGSRDEFYTVVIGTFLMACVPLFYIFATASWHIYLIQAIYGLANALAVPAWRIIFTRYINKKAVGRTWSLEDVGVGAATAISCTIGAIVADRLGFQNLFIIVAIFGFASACVLATLYRNPRIMHVPDHRQPDEGGAPAKIDTIK